MRPPRAVNQAVKDLSVFTAALARNADSIDDVVSNTKQATASSRDLSDNLDKRTADITSGVTKLTDNLDQRTADITSGVNKLTETATKQIEVVGADAHRTLIHIDKAVSDLAKNPQRILFGSGK